MVLEAALFMAVSASSAGAAENNLGNSTTGLYQWSGVVKKVYFKSTDRYIVKMKDDAGAEDWFFTKLGPQALAVLLTQKLQQSPTRIIYVKNAVSHDQQNCVDVPYELWVCKEIHYIDAE